MKKLLSLVILTVAFISFTSLQTFAGPNYGVTPRAPKISESLKPIIVKYKSGNYVGAMQDLEELVKVEKKNTYARYYLALCYTRLGYKEEATALYREVVARDENLVLSYYSQRALSCLENPNNTVCLPKEKQEEKKEEQMTEMDIFIQSGRKIHPAAMDKITRERMERKLQEEEHIRLQQEQEAAMRGELQSYNQPTNEEIASALNTLSKIGMNPYNQFNPLASAQQFNQYGVMGLNNPTMYSAFLGNSNQDAAKMFLYNQMLQQNSMLNYGI